MQEEECSGSGDLSPVKQKTARGENGRKGPAEIQVLHVYYIQNFEESYRLGIRLLLTSIKERLEPK